MVDHTNVKNVNIKLIMQLHLNNIDLILILAKKQERKNLNIIVNYATMEHSQNN